MASSSAASVSGFESRKSTAARVAAAASGTSSQPLTTPPPSGGAEGDRGLAAARQRSEAHR
jgi:hypothetical protein